jgi:hypothetical protein
VKVGKQSNKEIQKVEMEQRTAKGEKTGKRKAKIKGVERQIKGEIINNKGEKKK